MIDQDYIDGTLENLVRNRLINEGTFNIDSQQLQTLINQEYNKQVNSAKQIFMSQGDDLIATITAEVTDENIDEVLT